VHVGPLAHRVLLEERDKHINYRRLSLHPNMNMSRELLLALQDFVAMTLTSLNILALYKLIYFKFPKCRPDDKYFRV